MKFETHEDSEGVLIARALQEVGVTSVTFTMSGSGDGGDIDDTEYEFSGEWKNVKEHLRKFTLPGQSQDMMESLRDRAIEAVSNQGNWWDNDGGAGGVTYQVTDNGLVEEEVWMTPNDPDEDCDDDYEDEPNDEPDL